MMCPKRDIVPFTKNYVQAGTASTSRDRTSNKFLVENEKLTSPITSIMVIPKLKNIPKSLYL